MDDESIDPSDWVISSDKLLGSGTWSNVYYACHSSSRAGAACKVILKNTKEKIRLARNEIVMLMELRHPSIIRLYSVVNKTDRYELFLEYFEEGDLYSRTMQSNDGNLPYRECKIVARQILSVLKYLHSHDIIHRDIKADNILVRGDNVVLCDFGLTRKLQPTEYLTEWVGSPMYASPELVERIPYRKGPDVWAFGVLIYTLVTGAIPFDELEERASTITLLDVTGPPKYDHHLLSARCIDLLRTIFVVAEKKRATIEDVGKHEWFIL